MGIQQASGICNVWSVRKDTTGEKKKKKKRDTIHYVWNEYQPWFRNGIWLVKRHSRLGITDKWPYQSPYRLAFLWGRDAHTFSDKKKKTNGKRTNMKKIKNKKIYISLKYLAREFPAWAHLFLIPRTIYNSPKNPPKKTGLNQRGSVTSYSGYACAHTFWTSS